MTQTLPANPPQTGRTDPKPAPVKRGVPEGLWMRCVACGESLFRKAVAENLNVCTSCGHHFRVPARQRAEQLCDTGSFEERHADLVSTDPLGFVDRKGYPERLAAERAKSGEPDALVCGRGFVKGRPVLLAAMDPTFMMGSMGGVVGGEDHPDHRGGDRRAAAAGDRLVLRRGQDAGVDALADAARQDLGRAGAARRGRRAVRERAGRPDDRRG